MDLTYAYWHPEQKGKTPAEEDRGGFYNPLKLVTAGWQEWKATGRYPHPEELARRLNTRFKGDIDYFNELIERARPSDDKDKA